MAGAFVVRVHGNLVVAIERVESTGGTPLLGTPLEVGTQLATNYRETGRLDDDYLFADSEGAREFASLCLQFMKNLVEQRAKAIGALPIGFDSYGVASNRRS